MSDSNLTNPFKRMAGDKADLIPNIQAAGQILRDFIAHCTQESAQELSEISSVSEVTYFNAWEDTDDGYIQINYEVEIVDNTYEATIEIRPSGMANLSMQVLNPEGHVTSKEEDRRNIWVITDPSTIAHQVIQFIIEDPESILVSAAIRF